jgi:hypothetical protein
MQDDSRLIIFGKPIRFWATLFIVIVVLCIALAVWRAFALITVDVKYSDGLSGNNTIIKAIANGKFVDMQKLGGVYIVPRATSSLLVTGSGTQSVKAVTVPEIGIGSATITLHKDTNAVPYSDDSKGCLLYNAESDGLSSYDCANTTGIYSYKTPSNSPWHSSKDSTLPSSHDVKQYLNGFIGINSSGSDKPIFYAANNSFTYLPLPSDMNTAQLPFATIVTDKLNLDNPRFLLVTMAGDIYLAAPSNGSVTYTKYVHPDNYNQSADATLCALQNTTAYCYQGLSSHAPAEDNASNQKGVSQIAILNFNGDKITYKISTLPADLSLDTLLADEHHDIFGLGKNVLYSFSPQGATAQPIVITTGVTSADSGSKPYFVQADAVYEYDAGTQQSNLRFRSDHIQPKTLAAFGDDIFVNATVADTGETLHTYKLTNDIHTGTRPIDVLPLPITSSPQIITTSFVKDTLYVMLKVTIAKQATSLAQAIDPNELAASKASVLELLKTKGIDTSAINVVFGY